MGDDKKGKGPGNPRDPLTPLNSSIIPKKQVAVALSDTSDPDGLPRISAAGRGKIAEQILQLAFEHGIKVREDADLAELLAKVELDSPIPSDAFLAVAEILSYVYRANGEPNPFDAVLRDVIDRQQDGGQPPALTKDKNAGND